MKKSMFIFFSFFILFGAFAQQTDYNLSEVITVENKNAEQLYVSGKEWFAKAFKSANDVLQMDDAVAGKLIGKGSTLIRGFIDIGIPFELKFDLTYTISIAVKDGRYKYEVTDIMVDDGMTGTMALKYYKDGRQKYVDSSTFEGVKAEYAAKGEKIDKSTAKTYALTNAEIVKLIDSADTKLAAMIESLKIAMAKQVENW